jgi:hypothetical protein
MLSFGRRGARSLSEGTCLNAKFAVATLPEGSRILALSHQKRSLRAGSVDYHLSMEIFDRTGGVLAENGDDFLGKMERLPAMYLCVFIIP